MDKKVILTPEFERKYLSLDDKQIEFASNLCKDILSDLKKKDNERTILVPIKENSEFWEAKKVVVDQIFRSLRNRITFEDIKAFQIKTTLIIDVKVTNECVWFILLEFVCEHAVLRDSSETTEKTRIRKDLFKETNQSKIPFISAKRVFRDGFSKLLKDTKTLKRETIGFSKFMKKELGNEVIIRVEAFQVLLTLYWRVLLKSYVFRRIMKNFLPKTFSRLIRKEEIVCRVFSKLIYQEGVTEEEFQQFLQLSDEVPYLDLKERWFDLSIPFKEAESTS